MTPINIGVTLSTFTLPRRVSILQNKDFQVKKRNNSGMTLIELIVVVVIITIIVNIVIARFTNIKRKTDESTTKSNLYTMVRTIRYYSTAYGEYPSTLDDLIKKGYLNKIPAVHLSNHAPTNEVKYGSIPEDSGKWMYDSSSGELRVDCTHRDLEGNLIYEWEY